MRVGRKRRKRKTVTNIDWYRGQGLGGEEIDILPISPPSLSKKPKSIKNCEESLDLPAAVFAGDKKGLVTEFVAVAETESGVPTALDAIEAFRRNTKQFWFFPSEGSRFSSTNPPKCVYLKELWVSGTVQFANDNYGHLMGEKHYDGLIEPCHLHGNGIYWNKNALRPAKPSDVALCGLDDNLGEQHAWKRAKDYIFLQHQHIISHQLHVRRIYIPVWDCEYYHNGSHYRAIINAINGQVRLVGDVRPYALL